MNVDHVATLRQARGGVQPDPLGAATLALVGGADGIVVHLREDRRHIQERDARPLRQTVHGLFCLELAALPAQLKLALEIRPDSVTLVPERRDELTTEGGLDVQSRLGDVGEIVRALHEAKIRSCLFIEPDLDQIKAAHRVGANSIELHTGRYAERGPDQADVLRRIEDGVRAAEKLRLEVGVGHGLDYRNVAPLARIAAIEEFSIGHAIVSRALLVGMEAAVREMKALVRRA